jgi:hypothetical protein
MPDKMHRLQYRNVNWDKVEKRQEKKWAAMAGEVTVSKVEVDPEVVERLKQRKQDEQNLIRERSIAKQERRKMHEQSRRERRRKYFKNMQSNFEGKIK